MKLSPPEDVIECLDHYGDCASYFPQSDGGTWDELDTSECEQEKAELVRTIQYLQKRLELMDTGFSNSYMRRELIRITGELHSHKKLMDFIIRERNASHKWLWEEIRRLREFVPKEEWYNWTPRYRDSNE